MSRKKALSQSGRCAQTNLLQKNVKMPSGDDMAKPMEYVGSRMHTTVVEQQLPESGRSGSQVIAIRRHKPNLKRRYDALIF